MPSTDRVSIVVPVYNAQKFLLRCIHSLQNQSYKNLEILLVDDGSRDSSLSICQEEAAKDTRIKVIHKENGGVASARNAGMDVMTGQWLMLIDADDHIHRDMVRDLLAAAKREKAQVAVCGFEREFADGTPPEVHSLEVDKASSSVVVVDGAKRKRLTALKKVVNGDGGWVWGGGLAEFTAVFLVPLYQNLMLRTQSNKLYSVSVLRKHKLAYPDGISINEDIWFCVRFLTFCERIACISGHYLYYWQSSPGSSQISCYHPEGVESCFLLLEAVEQLLQAATASERVWNKMENEMLFHICGFAGHNYYRTRKREAECYREICRLAGRKALKRLVKKMKPQGLKNRTAAFLLGHGYCRLYHLLCLGLYKRQRQAFLAKEHGKMAAAKRRKKLDQRKKAKENSEAEEEMMVSISCVAYNHGPYIARALDSLVRQKTNFRYEILVYDDASTDNTQEIIRAYEKQYPKLIKPYYQTENQYSQGKYNVEGFFNYPRAKGKYTAMIDCDDYWTDDQKLQLQVDYMEAHPECAMCFHRAGIETPERAVQAMEIRPYKKSRLVSAEEVIDKPSNYPTASLLFRTEYTRDLQDYYYVSPVGDIPIQIHMAAKGTVYYMDRKMSVYQQGVSVSWSSLMKQGDYKQNLIRHHNAMKVMYRGFSKETEGKYDRAIERACRRMDFLTLLNVKEYREALAPGYRRFYRELDVRTRFLIRFELIAPRLYRRLQRLVYGEVRG